MADDLLSDIGGIIVFVIIALVLVMLMKPNPRVQERREDYGMFDNVFSRVKACPKGTCRRTPLGACYKEFCPGFCKAGTCVCGNRKCDKSCCAKPRRFKLF